MANTPRGGHGPLLERPDLEAGGEARHHLLGVGVVPVSWSGDTSWWALLVVAAGGSAGAGLGYRIGSRRRAVTDRAWAAGAGQR